VKTACCEPAPADGCARSRPESAGGRREDGDRGAPAAAGPRVARRGGPAGWRAGAVGPDGPRRAGDSRARRRRPGCGSSGRGGGRRAGRADRHDGRPGRPLLGEGAAGRRRGHLRRRGRLADRHGRQRPRLGHCSGHDRGGRRVGAAQLGRYRLVGGQPLSSGLCRAGPRADRCAPAVVADLAVVPGRGRLVAGAAGAGVAGLPPRGGAAPGRRRVPGAGRQPACGGDRRHRRGPPRRRRRPQPGL
jgi:hypothetical protein